MYNLEICTLDNLTGGFRNEKNYRKNATGGVLFAKCFREYEIVPNVRSSSTHLQKFKFYQAALFLSIGEPVRKHPTYFKRSSVFAFPRLFG